MDGDCESSTAFSEGMKEEFSAFERFMNGDCE